MKKILIFLPLLFIGWNIDAQRLEQFSESRSEFIEEMEGFMTLSKRSVMVETFENFETVFNSGLFNDEEYLQIRKTSNLMLNQRMGASPYFQEYLKALTQVKLLANGEQKFKEWHAILDNILTSDENRITKPFKEFVRFSNSFFVNNALQYSKSGTSWFALADDYSFQLTDGKPTIKFEKLDLIARQRSDSIFITQTSGTFDPVENVFTGKGGRIDWDRFKLDEMPHVELDEFSLEVKTSLYRASNATLYYPLFFGPNGVKGDFSDKVVASNSRGEITGSYPRFESYKKVLEVKNIGEGIRYLGGFRMQGTTVYGFGTKENPALVTISDKKRGMVLKGTAELFRIRKGERIAGERVKATLYMGNDSLFHPSVNMKFDIGNQVIELTRGDRGSDRNPFYSSKHQINIDAENLFAYIPEDSVVIGKKAISSFSNKPEVFFESLDFFEKATYERIQNIASANPLAIMNALYHREGTRFLPSNEIARFLNKRFTKDNIQSLLYDLVAKGFINYDNETEMVELKEKVFHYVEADRGERDYDVLKIKSDTKEANAYLNLKNNTIAIDGVSSLELSSSQRVGLRPLGAQLLMKGNRNLDFDGTVFAGFTTLTGKDFHFNYQMFEIGMDSVRYFDLFVPTGQYDEQKQPIAESIASRIEHLGGVLQIDAPSNKSGLDTIVIFPSVQSQRNSYVYYDNPNIQGGVYLRDSFYFELYPFSLNHVDQLRKEDISFDGQLVSADIFPNFDETIHLVEEDYSLGFESKTPDEGFPNYQGKGLYTGEISLSNKGLWGVGNLKYLGATVDSEDIRFRPKQLLATAQEFNLEENRGGDLEVPQAKGVNVSIDWRPYQDSMYVRSAEAPFALFKEDNHQLQGKLILTPGGLKGDGLFEWDEARMTSQLFSFGAFSAEADTTDLAIKSVDPEKDALYTSNVNGKVDFDEKTGKFVANDEYLITELPFNEYTTSMNEFTWDMEKAVVKFKSDTSRIGQFTASNTGADSLTFSGANATYYLNTAELNIEGVPFVIASDAFIIPDSGLVKIGEGGVMNELKNAQIIADTISKYHVINRATVNIEGRRIYRASGFYEYNVGDREQEFELQNIIGQPVGKGSYSEKKSITRATGEILPEDDFYIDFKTKFRGTISLDAQSKALQFDGFARLEADKLPRPTWFSISSKGDKKDLAIKYDTPRDLDGNQLKTGLYLSRSTGAVYPSIMMPLQQRKDRPLFPTEGIFKYDKSRDYFIFGDSLKIEGGSLTGNVLTFKNALGTIDMDGKFYLGQGLNYVKVAAAGRGESEFKIVEIDTNSVSLQAPPPIKPTKIEIMAGINMVVPDNIIDFIVKDFNGSGFILKPISYLTDLNFYRKSISELFPTSDKDVREALTKLTSGILDFPKKSNPYTFLFSKLDMEWLPDYQSFMSTNKDIGIISIGGEMVNQVAECYVECKMPSNEDDRIYILIKSPTTGNFYFFGYKQGILNITSNSQEFLTEVSELKDKERIIKMDDGQTYEIQVVEDGDARRFERRIKTALKNK